MLPESSGDAVVEYYRCVTCAACRQLVWAVGREAC
jgi:hypothetical protein